MTPRRSRIEALLRSLKDNAAQVHSLDGLNVPRGAIATLTAGPEGPGLALEGWGFAPKPRDTSHHNALKRASLIQDIHAELIALAELFNTLPHWSQSGVRLGIEVREHGLRAKVDGMPVHKTTLAVVTIARKLDEALTLVARIPEPATRTYLVDAYRFSAASPEAALLAYAAISDPDLLTNDCAPLPAVSLLCDAASAARGARALIGSGV